ncbi:fimbrial assembly protein [Bdellovibrio bacteriovorus]|uniref:Fimbrial assembly protein n=1 Tax=Bdellovibrio bacteriovorus TaxID=959 RepID=A0A150WSR7_BDEBC|nr:type IV pilus secretin PilQ [Bdellovibrio bacteriovorus]KYG67407.1 fimbrial assembly protein [Bdellovibrio bacteriovorus]
MNGFIRLLILSALITSLLSCTSAPVEDDMAFDGTESSDSAMAADDSGGSGDDFSEFEDSGSNQTAEAAPTESSGDQDLAIEDEFNEPSANGSADQGIAEAPAEPPADMPADVPADHIAEEDPFADPAIADVPAPDVPAPAPEPDLLAPAPEPVPVVDAPAPEPEHEPMPTSSPAMITDLQFRANDTGGTIVVKADRPLNYTTRANTDLQQFVIEVENAILPEKLKRSLNTKDIKGSIGAVDAYQNPGSNVARFVIQLRQGLSEPAVQAEGSSLLIVANSQAVGGVAAAPADDENEKILPSEDLTGFLANNTQFYGKKISIETNNMDVRDALGFITEESGVNMVITEDVKGPINLKLRQVPWDQALVVIMKAKKLGYARQGNVLRIAPLADLKAEEDDATKLAQSKRTIEPLKVRMFPVSYARVDDLEKKIKEFLGERGRVIGDARTNALVVTDIEENLERAAKLIASLDTQPPQVLIEGRLVEASESFSRSVGVTWNSSGAPIRVGSTSRGPVQMVPTFNVNPGVVQGGNFNFNLSVGTLDFFGTLGAALTLAESEQKVKVISAPRVMTMTNETAVINQTTEVPLRQVTQNANTTVETITFKPLVLKLEVTPQVTADGSVIMKVNVNRQFRGADVGTAGAFSVNSREANTRVLVKNGQTAVIGGIFQSDATEGEAGIPWLREIPVFGNLFKSRGTTREKSELLVFVTPRIMGQVDGNAPTEEL